MHAASALQARLAQGLQITLVITRLEKTRLAIIPTLHHVLGDTHQIEPLHPWHCRPLCNRNGNHHQPRMRQPSGSIPRLRQKCTLDVPTPPRFCSGSARAHVERDAAAAWVWLRQRGLITSGQQLR